MKKYRELIELKKLLRENKIKYKDMAKCLNISTSTFSKMINGYLVFDIIQVCIIINRLQIPQEKIPVYFF